MQSIPAGLVSVFIFWSLESVSMIPEGDKCDGLLLRLQRVYVLSNFFHQPHGC
jgi:hypothetical protein